MRCQVFYRRVKELLETEDIDALEHFCKKEAKETLFRIRRYVEFWERHMQDLPIGSISERALRPIIEGEDPDVAAQVVEKILPLTRAKGKKKLRVTSETVKKVLAQVKGEVYLTTTERKQIGCETHLKQTEVACDEFLAWDAAARAEILTDLRRIFDLLGTWSARSGPNLRAKIDPVREQVNALRNELLLFLPEEAEVSE